MKRTETPAPTNTDFDLEAEIEAQIQGWVKSVKLKASNFLISGQPDAALQEFEIELLKMSGYLRDFREKVWAHIHQGDTN